ncbi:MAG TPA: Mu transposase C-terminal domain-containing protein [Microthrixaceae bacterium]|nr:Mu transposase C-terminal domain-containing protein [Microthrixaceae bacterium]
MSRWWVRVGDRVRWDDVEWTVVAFDGRCVTLRDGRRVVTVVPGELAAEPLSATGLFGLAPAAEQRRASALERHVLDVETGRGDDSRYDPGLTTVTERVAAKLDELRGDREFRWPTSQAWLYAQRKAYRDAAASTGSGLDGLIRGDSVRVTARLDRDVVDVVADVLAAEVDGPKVTFDVLYRRFSAEFSRRHPDRTGPSKAKLREYFNRSPEGRYQLTVNTRTKRTNRRRHRSVFEPRRVYLPGDRVEFDGTRADFFVTGDDGAPFRPWVLTAFDVATRSLVAARLAVSENAFDGALLLYDMVSPSKPLPAWGESVRFAATRLGLDRDGDVFADVVDAAVTKPVVVPNVAVIDGGKAWQSNGFRNGLAQLECSVENARPYTATDKAAVERAHRTLATRAFQHLPGYCGSDVSARGVDTPAVELLTFAEAEAMLLLVTLGFAFTPSESLRDPWFPRLARTPNEAWVDSLAAGGFIPRPADPDFAVRFLTAATREIQSTGVAVNNRLYRAPDLADLRAAVAAGAVPKKVTVRYDPRDPTYVFVLDPRTNRHLPLRWTDADRIYAPLGDLAYTTSRRRVVTPPAGDRHRVDIANLLADHGYTASPSGTRQPAATDPTGNPPGTPTQTAPPRRKRQPKQPFNANLLDPTA